MVSNKKIFHVSLYKPMQNMWPQGWAPFWLHYRGCTTTDDDRSQKLDLVTGELKSNIYLPQLPCHWDLMYPTPYEQHLEVHQRWHPENKQIKEWLTLLRPMDFSIKFEIDSYLKMVHCIYFRVPTEIQKHNSMTFPWFSTINNVISMTF